MAQYSLSESELASPTPNYSISDNDLTGGTPDYSLSEEELTPKKKPIKSQPIKQAAAGLLADTAAFPALFGMAGSGIQAGYNTLTGDKDFVENYKAASTDGGIDQTLIDAGVGARKTMMDIIGVGEAQTTADQAARLLGSFLLPVPAGFLGGAAATGLKGALGKAATFALPAVRLGGKGNQLNKTFRTRALTSLGVGTTLDQGFRALADSPDLPLLLSEEALSGVIPEPVVSKYDISSDMLDGTPEGLKELIDIEQRTERAAQREDLIFIGKVILGAVGVGAAAKWARSGSVVSPKAQVGNALHKVHKDGIDKAGYLADDLREIGRTPENIAKTVHDAHTDPLDMAVNYNLTGELGQEFVPQLSERGIPKRSMTPDEITNRLHELGPEKAKIYEEALVQERQLALLQQAEAKGTHELFPYHRKAMKEHEKSIVLARSDDQVAKMLDDVHETYDNLLDYAVHRNNESAASAAVFRENNTVTINGKSRIVYSPLYAKDKSNFFARMAERYLGVTTKEGRRAGVLAEEYGKAGIEFPKEIMDSATSLRRYATSVITHANTEVFKGNVLDNLTQITRDKNYHRTGKVTRAEREIKSLDENGNEITSMEFVPTANEAQYVGKANSLDDIERILINVDPGNKAMSKKFTSGSLRDMQATKDGKSLVTAHVGGELRVYYVPNAGTRAALELNPQLTAGWQALSNWKALFSKHTTGSRSFFAPFSGTFSAQQIATNTASREGLFKGIKSVGESLGGVARLAVASGSGDIARFLATRISRHMGKASPEFMRKMEQVLDAKFRSSILNLARKETGRTVTGFNIGHGTVDDVLERIGKPSIDYFGKDAAGLVHDLWQTWNTAWHEGPAYGAMHKHIGGVIQKGQKVTPRVIRDAVDISKSVAGDMNRIGASNFAKNFNAAIPFSSAMIQSWNSIGASAKGNWGKFMTGAVALIGAPTATELIYNQVLNDTPDPVTGQPKLWQDLGNPEKFWTYSDYYWNKYTTEQRVNNFIYFVPGKPPWEAILVPVSPEWSLFRAATIEGMDAVFNFSDVGDINVVNSVPGQAGHDGQKFAETKFNRDHFIVSMARAFDVAIPPPLAALYSSMGLDARFGLTYEEPNDPDNPSAGFSVMRAHNIASGERVTRSLGKTRFTEGEISRTSTAMIQDIWGAAGAQYVNFHNAFMAGVKKEDGGFMEGISDGFDAFTQTSLSQARYLQPLIGKAVRGNASSKESRKMFAIKETMKALDKDWKIIEGGGIMFSNGVPIPGYDTIKISDDPKAMELGAAVGDIKQDIADYEKEIATIKKSISTMGHSTILGSAREKADKIDASYTEIQRLTAQQLSIIHDWENKLGDYLTDRYGTDPATGKVTRQITIDLSKYKRNPDVNQGSTLKGFLNSR